MYLLDTNVCIDFLKGRSEPVRVRMLATALPELTVSAITAGELLVGSRRSPDPSDERPVRALLAQLSVAPFDRSAATEYGALARRIGPRRKSFDRLIAAHALALNLTLVTNNEADFADIPGLRIENWTL